MFDVAIVGLGYVGLPLCLQFAKNGSKVLGLDIDPKKVDALMLVNPTFTTLLRHPLPSRLTGTTEGEYRLFVGRSVRCCGDLRADAI